MNLGNKANDGEERRFVRYLTLQETSEYSRLSPKSIFNHRKSGKLKSHLVGGRVLVKESDLIDFIEGNFNPET